jgi:hypothetical protein
MKTVAASILFLPVGVYAAGRPDQLTDYYRVGTAGTPAISPDGNWVVFVRNTIVEAENQCHSELWISPSNGSIWSPDGKLLIPGVGGGPSLAQEISGSRF